MPLKILFVSTRFLFPPDSGGKIRTTQILRGLRSNGFKILLASPAPSDGRRFEPDLAAVADGFVSWPETPAGGARRLRQASLLASRLPVSVASDRSAAGAAAVARQLSAAPAPDVIVADFPHADVLLPPHLPIPSVLFTHNVEAEILARHAATARGPLMRAVWRSQYRKMRDFERAALGRYDGVVAVSERDGEFFKAEWGIRDVTVIPTGVDLDFFAYHPPRAGGRVVFTGSMDWLANQDGIQFFMDEVWALVALRVPTAKMIVVGRAPPQDMMRRAAARGFNWEFTGFVDDVRPYLAGASAYVVPLRVGGGTRIKVYEAMASGCPVVSTDIGVEGLPVEEGTHFVRANTPEELAAGVISLLGNEAAAAALAERARSFVEEKCSFRFAARIFGDACQRAFDRRRAGERVAARA